MPKRVCTFTYTKKAGDIFLGSKKRSISVARETNKKINPICKEIYWVTCRTHNFTNSFWYSTKKLNPDNFFFFASFANFEWEKNYVTVSKHYYYKINISFPRKTACDMQKYLELLNDKKLNFKYIIIKLNSEIYLIISIMTASDCRNKRYFAYGVEWD